MLLTRLLEPFTDLVRWGEPWDVEDDDPLFEPSAGADETSFSLWT